ncbi:MAG: glycerol-3-phosphate dehydrogenase, partial [Undibacterium sp.]|nr:glycerol-3-phosphate dehydrogenase [Undibacterium sp.]
MNITILGAGAWGTALAISLASKNQVLLWGRNQSAMQAAQEQRENRRSLAGFSFPNNLQATSDFAAAMRHSGEDGLLIIASSVAGLRPILTQCKGYSTQNVVWLCKGFEETTNLLPHQVVQQVLGDGVNAGALSGPSF